MEVASLWVALVGALAAIGAAVFAFVQAKAATDSRREAQEARDESREARDESARLAAEANDAFKRQAEAQEEANRLKREEMTPDDWSAPVHVRGVVWRVSNTAKRVLLVESFEVHPDAAKGLVTVRTHHEDGRYDFGDSFELTVVRASGIRAEKLTVQYRYEDDPAGAVRTLFVGL